MATGPEHYRTAEQRIGYAQDAEAGSDVERFHLEAAKVHAALANAAATVLAAEVANVDRRRHGAFSEWNAAMAAGEGTAQ